MQFEVNFPGGGSVIIPHVGLAADAPPSLAGEARPIMPCVEGWGDKTEKWLTSIGITSERYIEVKKKFGLPPTCWCPQRKEWLNKVEKWWKGH
jgi:hypothetical protein